MVFKFLKIQIKLQNCVCWKIKNCINIFMVYNCGKLGFFYYMLIKCCFKLRVHIILSVNLFFTLSTAYTCQKPISNRYHQLVPV